MPYFSCSALCCMTIRTVQRPNITSRCSADADMSTDYGWITMGHSRLERDYTRCRECRHIRCKRQSPDRRKRVLLTEFSERTYRSHQLLPTSAGYNEELRQDLERSAHTLCFLGVYSLIHSYVDNYINATLANFGWTNFA
jgi:hypothetical protein